MLADNRIALNAAWVLDMLKLELKDLSEIGAELSILGFTKRELGAALEPAGMTGLTDENDVPQVADVAVASVGNIWCLGNHRLACCDSTDPGIVKTLLGSSAPHLMVTDPPYGFDYDPTWRHRAGVNKSSRVGKVRNDERADWALFPAASPISGTVRRTPSPWLKVSSNKDSPFAPNHLGEGAPGHRSRRLPLAARAVLVRGAQEGKLDRGPQADHALRYSERRVQEREIASQLAGLRFSINVTWVGSDPESHLFAESICGALKRTELKISSCAPAIFLGEQPPRGVSIVGPSNQ
jgi:hypothetical protein